MTSKHVIGVLDLTFCDIETEEQYAKSIQERGNFILPNSPGKSHKTNDLVVGALLNSNSVTSSSLVETNNGKKGEKLEEVTAIRLGNNMIKLLKLITSPSLTNIIDITKLVWLDLSFNQINKIPEKFSEELPNVTTIYMQANQVSRLSEIKKFSGFKALKSLTLFGNPIEEHKHYRNMVLHSCGKLAQFDMSPVTRTERKRCEIWANTFRKKLHPEDYW